MARVAMVTLSAVVMLVGLELVLRIVKRNDPPERQPAGMEAYYAEKICLVPPPFKKEGSARVPDPFLGYKFAPFGTIDASTSNYTLHIVLDRLGFRANDEGFTGDEENLWFLGDSHTFGLVQEEEDTYAKVVEARLNRLAGRVRFHALIHGVVGWGTVNVNRLAYRLKPTTPYRTAILGFCVSNDIINNLYYEDRPVSEPAVPDTASIRRIMDELGYPPLYRHSYLARFVWNRLPIDYFIRYRIMVRDESIARTRRELDRLLEVIGRGRLVVVIIPLLSQVTDSWVARWSGLDRINEAVGEWCRENDVPCLDLLDATRGHPEYYYTMDNHYTPEGNHAVGEIIADFLVEKTGILE